MSVPRWTVPLLIVVATLAGLGAARMISIPSVELEFPSAAAGSPTTTRTAEFLVDGVKCVDTALQAASTLEETPGVLRYVAYASRNRVEVTHDPGQVGVEELREALEGPVYDEESGEFLFGSFEVIEIDGKPVSK